MDVSIVIISYNTCGLLRDCLASVREKTSGIDYDVFVVDNASQDDSCEMVERDFPWVHLVRNPDNRGFAKANNQAIPMAQGEYILLLNSDTILENNAIKQMHEFMQMHLHAGVCGPLLLNEDGTVQQSMDTHYSVTNMIARLIMGTHRNWWRRGQGNRYHPNDFDYSKLYQLTDGWLTGAALMIRKSALAEVGLLDEHYHFFMEDADWGLAVTRSGWETWFVPQAQITHLLGGSRKSLSNEREMALKINTVKQQHYYVVKNFGKLRRVSFELLSPCCYFLNILRRLVNILFGFTQNYYSHSMFKVRLAYRLFLASVKREKRCN